MDGRGYRQVMCWGREVEGLKWSRYLMIYIVYFFIEKHVHLFFRKPHFTQPKTFPDQKMHKNFMHLCSFFIPKASLTSN